MTRPFLIMACTFCFVKVHAQSCDELNQFVTSSFGKVTRDSALQMARVAVSVCSVSANTVNYLMALNNITQIYSGTALHDSTLKYAQAAVSVYEASTNAINPIYIRVLTSLGYALEKKLLPDSAMSVYRKATQLFAIAVKEPNANTKGLISVYLECVNSMVLMNIDRFRFFEGRDLVEEAVKIIKQYKYPVRGSSAYLLLTSAYGGLLLATGDRSGALSIFYTTLDLCASLPKVDSLFYAKTLNNIGSIYQNAQQYQKALPFLEKSLAIKARRTNEQDESYLNSVNNIGALHLNMERYSKALQIFKRLDSITLKFNESSVVHMNAINNLALSYSGMGNTKAALATTERYLAIAASNKNNNPVNFAYSLGAIGYTFMQMKDYPKAKKYLDSALRLYEKIPAANISDIINFKNNLATVYEELGNYAKSISTYKDLIAVHKQYYPGDFDSRFTYLTNLMVAYAANKNIASALVYLEEASGTLRSQMENRLGIQSDDEKAAYIRGIDNILQVIKSMVSRSSVTDKKKYAAIIYDNELMMKGFLLTSQRKVRYAIENLNDPSAMQLYTKWRAAKLKLFQSRSGFFDNKTASALKAEIEDLEQQLAQISNVFSADLDEFHTDWKKISHSLKPDEVLIDYFFYRVYTTATKSTKQIRYAAMMLKKDSPSPEWVDLFNQDELDKLLVPSKSAMIERDKINEVYGVSPSSTNKEVVENRNNEKLFNLIWKPLLSRIGTAQKIYFVPVNKLYSISLLALHDKRQFLIDRFEMLQLQNGMEIARLSSEPGKQETTLLAVAKMAVLFGGIQYNFSAEQMKTFHLPEVDNPKEIYDSLPETRAEIDTISNMLRKLGVITSLYQDDSASEENFKSICQNGPSIIEIATHGFFSRDSATDLLIDPLERAGLLLAHGNYTIAGGKIPDSLSDGILTAAEISLLDFKNTNLLILSACETGVGEIRGSEGIYGLQRGCKLAGVQSLIVSLWKVSEKGTFQFMQTFFSQLSTGKDIPHAFQKTQQIMKDDFNPYFWGAFVLVN